MHLDLPTLMTMEGFVAAYAGAVLFAAWWQDRETSALLSLAFGDIAAAGGILSLMLGSVLRQSAWFVLGGTLLALAPALMWKAARAFDAKPAPTPFVLLGVAVVAIAKGIPGVRDIAIMLTFATGAVYFVAAATTLWLGRNERLAARWPLIGLIILHAMVLLVGAVSAFSGAVGEDGTPPVASLFGFIHFEAMIFVVGTAVFMLALVKERKEVAISMTARIDGLTGISNRAAFMEAAERVIQRCRREGAPVAVLMFDLDRFKAINDTFGHAIGDDVIRKFCEVTAAALRPNDVFGRLGGEEFGVVLPGSSIEAACIRAERIRVSFAEHCRIVAGHQVDARVSGGVAVSEDAEQPLSALLEYADVALYRAKAEGRNRIERANQPKPKNGSSSVVRVA